MPQEIRVLKCFDCSLFQVDIVKKSNKWRCKVCNSKQTLRREYLRGSGAECRAKVQELNMRTGEEQRRKDDNLLELLATNDVDECDWNAIESVERALLDTQPDNVDLNNGCSKDGKEVEQNMFNFSNTQQWSRSPDEDVDTTIPSKKSKWERFV